MTMSFEDEFYGEGTSGDFTETYFTNEDKAFLRGRLSEITGLVAEEPIKPRNITLSDILATDIYELVFPGEKCSVCGHIDRHKNKRKRKI